jgi:hypothetical protein
MIAWKEYARFSRSGRLVFGETERKKKFDFQEVEACRQLV